MTHLVSCLYIDWTPLQTEGASSANHCWCQKISTVHCLVLSQNTRVTDADRHADITTTANTALAQLLAVKKIHCIIHNSIKKTANCTSNAAPQRLYCMLKMPRVAVIPFS